jgi:hypothetical protein
LNVGESVRKAIDRAELDEREAAISTSRFPMSMPRMKLSDICAFGKWSAVEL